MDMNEWGEPISVYGDQQALDDGLLVDISKTGVVFHGLPINRITGALWADFEPFLEVGFALGMSEIAYISQMLRTKLNHAQLKGGIWQVPPGLWLMENEVGGWTLMKPEDY